VSYPIETIEGIAKVYGAGLRDAGITTTGQLLAKAYTPIGRKELAAKSGISEHLILKWADMADLMRIKGIATQYAELLASADVTCVDELATRVPGHLHQALIEANGKHKQVRQMPVLSQIEAWIAQAKTLPPRMEY